MVQAKRSVQQLAQLRHLREAGELQENLVNIFADGLVGSHEAVIGIQPRGLGVVVAGAQVAVAAQAFFLAPHHHHQFRVGLESEYSVHDVRTGFLQLGGQFDIGLLIETRPQLDDDRDVLTRRRRLDQRGDNGGVAAHSIQSLLDRQHLGIVRRLLDEVGDRPESLKRVMQQHIAGAQGGE